MAPDADHRPWGKARPLDNAAQAGIRMDQRRSRPNTEMELFKARAQREGVAGFHRSHRSKSGHAQFASKPIFRSAMQSIAGRHVLKPVGERDETDAIQPFLRRAPLPSEANAHARLSSGNDVVSISSLCHRSVSRAS